MSEAQRRAEAKYQKEKCKSILLRFFPTDMELYEHVKKQPKQAAYLKELIRKDMEGGN